MRDDDSPRRTTFLITGASRGIGYELTRQALERGDDVVATCRRPERAEALLALAEEYPDRAQVVPLNVLSGAGARRTLDAVGGRALDVLVNNAGIYGGKTQGLDGMDYEAWAEAFAVNAMAPFRVTTTLLPALRRSKRPRVLTISSVMGSITEGGLNSYAYSSSKTAVNKVMRMLADELREEGIVVAPAHPGWVRTDMGGPEADLAPEESAAGLLELIDRLDEERSGRFWTWESKELPW